MKPEYTESAGSDGEARAAFPPKLRLFHATESGNGSAMRMSLQPAEGQKDGYVMMTLAAQRTPAANGSPATFDWENKLCVKLGFSDICRMLQVLHGMNESIDGGKGLFHRHGRFMTKISLRHIVSPSDAYVIDVYRSAGGGEEERHAKFVLGSGEAYGVSVLLEWSICPICFGMPGAGAAAANAAGKGADAA